MYQPLAPDPLPPGPRVTNPLAPLLRLLLRVFNVALAALSLLLIAAALWMGEAYHRSDEPAPSPSPEDPNPDMQAAAAALGGDARSLLAPLAEQAVASAPWCVEQAALVALQL